MCVLSILHFFIRYHIQICKTNMNIMDIENMPHITVFLYIDKGFQIEIPEEKTLGQLHPN